jgi:hypothetical protein
MIAENGTGVACAAFTESTGYPATGRKNTLDFGLSDI